MYFVQTMLTHTPFPAPSWASASYSEKVDDLVQYVQWII
jgi:hypothetical protein